MADAIESSENDLDRIRGKLTEFQREVLNFIWEHYCQQNQWIVTRVLHHKFDRSRVLPALNQLGGSIVLQARTTDGKERYKLTFLGVLLTDRGVEAEKLLIKYLNYVREQFVLNPEIEIVTSQELKTGLGINAEQTKLLGQLIWLTDLWGNGSVGQGTEEWKAGMPYDLDELPSVSDFLAYIRAKALKDFDPAIPIDENERIRYLVLKSKKTGLTSEFDFISDLALQQQLASDWREAQSVHKIKAWKSCVLLCGSVIEGMLLDVLSRDEQRASDAYKRLRRKSAPEISRWNLVDLVEVAGELSILDKGTIYLGHALREFRNLIHPGKLIREKIIVTEEEADIALSAVKICLRALSRLNLTEKQ